MNDNILKEISDERERQLAKGGLQHRSDGTNRTFKVDADMARDICDELEKIGPRAGFTDGADWLSILEEEMFEAAAEVDTQNLRKELIQVAAVCVAWIDDLDRHDGK